MGYDIEVRTIERQPLAFIRTDDVAPPEIGKAFMRSLPEVFAHVGKAGAEPASAPLVRYPRHGDGTFDMETGVAIEAPVEPGDRVQVGELQGGEVAFTVHIGSYRKIGEAYDAVRAWLTESGRKANGAPWEVYVNGPQDTAEEDLRTEIYQPVS